MNDGFPDIELLMIYPRTSVYNRFYVGEIALHFSGVFVKKFGYDGDFKLFLIPDEEITMVFEWNPKVYWNVSNRFRIMAGALVTTGNVPNEFQKFRAIPVLDLQFSFKKKKNKNK